jgi:hypothetical protein
MSTEKVPKSSNYFNCECCNYITSRKSQYDRHILTVKHKKHEIATNSNKKVPKSSEIFSCNNCDRIYKDRTGLWRHNQKCNKNKADLHNINNPDDNSEQKEIIMLLMKENSEIKQMMMEVIKSGTHNTNTNNIHNKTFNLNFFLNETCKNAMNIMDFVNSLQLQLGDLEKMGDVGYVNGISNIIIKNLKGMDITERPVHCTDMKREVLYVKDEDKWDKETQEKPKLRKAIKYIARKNARLLQEFKKNHPDCIKSESKYSDTYNKLLIESMGGKGNDDELKEKKIIKNIAQEIIVDK